MCEAHVFFLSFFRICRFRTLPFFFQFRELSFSPNEGERRTNRRHEAVRRKSSTLSEQTHNKMRRKPTLAWLFAVCVCVVAATDAGTININDAERLVHALEYKWYMLLVAHHSTRLWELQSAATSEEAAEAVLMPPRQALALVEEKRKPLQELRDELTMRPEARPIAEFICEMQQYFDGINKRYFTNAVRDNIIGLDEHAWYVEHGLQSHFHFPNRPKPNLKYPLYVVDTTKPEVWQAREDDYTYLPVYLRVTLAGAIDGIYKNILTHKADVGARFLEEWIKIYPEVEPYKQGILRTIRDWNRPCEATARTLWSWVQGMKAHSTIAVEAWFYMVTNITMRLLFDLSLKILQYVRVMYPRFAEASGLDILAQDIERQRKAFVEILNDFTEQRQLEDTKQRLQQLTWIHSLGQEHIEKRFSVHGACNAHDIPVKVMYDIVDRVCPFMPLVHTMLSRAREGAYRNGIPKDASDDALLDHQMALDPVVAYRKSTRHGPLYTLMYPASRKLRKDIKALAIRDDSEGAEDEESEEEEDGEDGSQEDEEEEEGQKDSDDATGSDEADALERMAADKEAARQRIEQDFSNNILARLNKLPRGLLSL